MLLKLTMPKNKCSQLILINSQIFPRGTYLEMIIFSIFPLLHLCAFSLSLFTLPLNSSIEPKTIRRRNYKIGCKFRFRKKKNTPSFPNTRKNLFNRFSVCRTKEKRRLSHNNEIYCKTNQINVTSLTVML